MSYDPNSQDNLSQDHSGGLMSHHEEEPASMPLGVDDSFDDFSGDPSLDAALDPYGASKKGGSGILLFVVLIAVAGGVLWTMRNTGGVLKPSKANAESVKKVDEALQQLNGNKNNTKGVKSLFQDTNKVLSILSDSNYQNQVEVDEVQMNPFVLRQILGTSNKVKDDTKNAVLSNEDRQKMEQLKTLQKDLSMMSLQSILSGKESLAVISGKVVRPGNKIGKFKVTKITKQAVELTADNHTFSLQLKSK